MITITEQEKAYMIDKAKQEARFKTLLTIQGELYVKASHIDMLLDSKEAMNIYYALSGDKFIKINLLRNTLRIKARAYYNASGHYYEQAFKEQKEWEKNHKVEELF